MNISKIVAFGLLAVLASACASSGNNEMQTAQERRACADIGLDPGSAIFASCVGNLDASMFEANTSAYR